MARKLHLSISMYQAVESLSIYIGIWTTQHNFDKWCSNGVLCQGEVVHCNFFVSFVVMVRLRITIFREFYSAFTIPLFTGSACDSFWFLFPFGLLCVSMVHCCILLEYRFLWFRTCFFGFLYCCIFHYCCVYNLVLQCLRAKLVYPWISSVEEFLPWPINDSQLGMEGMEFERFLRRAGKKTIPKQLFSC